MTRSADRTPRLVRARHAAPPCWEGHDRGAGLAWVLGGLAGLAVVVLGVFFVFTQLAQETTDEVAVQEVREGSLEVEAFDAVEIGTPKEEVLTSLRPVLPVDIEVVDRYEGRSPETVAAECVSYERYGGRTGESFRFCFDEDVLVDKTILLAGDPGADSAVVDEQD